VAPCGGRAEGGRGLHALAPFDLTAAQLFVQLFQVVDPCF